MQWVAYGIACGPRTPERSRATRKKHWEKARQGPGPQKGSYWVASK